MGKTRRNEPVSKLSKQERLASEWERMVDRDRVARKNTVKSAGVQEIVESGMAPAVIPSAEVEKADGPRLASVQAVPPETGEGGGGLLWWTGGTIDDYIPVGEYGSRQRQEDLRAFCLVAPMVLNAESVLTKKMQALQWSVEAGRNIASKWQDILNNLDKGAGWDTFIARWVRAYSESDYGGYVEILRAAPGWAVDAGGVLTPRGKEAMEAGRDRAWPVSNAQVMDPCQCVPSADRDFPLIFDNVHTGMKHKLRDHQFMRILDMPNVDDDHPRQGVCATTRAVWAAQEDRMTTRYGFEAMSENPGTGMVLANVNQQLLETALKSAKQERMARGVVYYKGMLFLPVLNPSGSVKLEYLTFSHLPENFNRTEDYSRIKEIVASAFGLDVLELGSIPGHNLGSGAQATVAADKARGKGIGALIQGVERQFHLKFLPPTVQLQIKRHDIGEQKDWAELDQFYFQNAQGMMTSGAFTAEMALQYLADMGSIPMEYPYMLVDLTPTEELDDSEASEKRLKQGPRVRLDRHGKTVWAEKSYMLQMKHKALGDQMDSSISEEDKNTARARFEAWFPKKAGMMDAKPTGT